MTSFSFAAIPADLLSRWPHREISHCLEVKPSSKVLSLGQNQWVSNLSDTFNTDEKFDLAMVNLGSTSSIVGSLNRVVNNLKPNGYFGATFFHWPGMKQWFVYELQNDLLLRDRKMWEEGCRVLDGFLGEGKIQVVEREILEISPSFLEGVDLIKLFQQHWNSFDSCVDNLLMGKVESALQNIGGFLESSNSNLDLCIESIFGIREW